MTEPSLSFRDFEHQGWSTAEVASGYHEGLSPVTRQTIGALLDAAEVRHGTRVADVATGAGYVAAAAAGRGATAVGFDFSETQLALARRLYPDTEFRAGDAGALPLASGGLDAVVSNYGMPHFPDPDAFLREAFRVLRGGGKIAFSVWAAPAPATALGIVYGAVQAHGRTDVSLPPGPNFFLFSDPGECERSLVAAGFQTPMVAEVAQTLRVTSPEAPFEVVMKGTVRATALLRAQTPEAFAAIRAAVAKAASAQARGGMIELPMPAVVASAEKP